MIFKVPLIIEIKSYKTCQAKWDNIAISFLCQVKSSSVSGFKTLDLDINVPVGSFSKSIQQWPKWPFLILSLCGTNVETCFDVHHLLLIQ